MLLDELSLGYIVTNSRTVPPRRYCDLREVMSHSAEGMSPLRKQERGSMTSESDKLSKNGYLLSQV